MNKYFLYKVRCINLPKNQLFMWLQHRQSESCLQEKYELISCQFPSSKKIKKKF